MPRRPLASAALAAAIAVPAAADVLFSNFADGDHYLGDTGWTLMNQGPLQAHVEDAAVFTVSGGSFFLDQIDLAVGHLYGPNVLHVYIHPDVNGLPGGAVLEQVTLVDQMPPMPNDPNLNYPPVPVIFSGSTVLDEGASYWVHLSSDTTSDSWAAWNYNIVNDLSLRADRWDEGPWNPHTGDPRGTFRVLATPVPAPASLALLALGAGARRRRRCPGAGECL